MRYFVLHDQLIYHNGHAHRMTNHANNADGLPLRSSGLNALNPVISSDQLYPIRGERFYQLPMP